MNIIELVKDVLSVFPQMSMLNNGINVDFTESAEGSCGLYPTGDQLLKEDIIGNQDRQHNFVLYAKFQSSEECDRIMNSTFFLDLAYWLERASRGQKIEVTINDKSVPATLTKLSSANGMLYGNDTENLSGPVTYQLQIYAKYHLESEVLL
ncbi:hypothetical protein HNQ56_003738 [Anaerotaenia torta]|uniref:hypothetical protein n=1 Tax=Anaerotaenia torta TaxID=433293 RepID=UPI003D25F916